MKPIVTEKHEFEFQHKSIENPIWFLGLSARWSKEPAGWNSNQIFFSRCKVFDWNPHEINQTCSQGETPFRWLRLINFNYKFLGKMDYQDFEARITINGLSFKTTRSKAFNSDCDWWNQTYSCWAKSVWITCCIINDDIFQRFRTMGIVTQGTKPPIHQKSTLLQEEQFWLRPKWKNWGLYSWRKVSCNLEEIQ